MYKFKIPRNITGDLPQNFAQNYNPGVSMISLLLHESEVKPRTSVNNKISYKCTWVITCLFPKGLQQSMLLCTMDKSTQWLLLGVLVSPIKAFFVQLLI